MLRLARARTLLLEPPQHDGEDAACPLLLEQHVRGVAAALEPLDLLARAVEVERHRATAALLPERRFVVVRYQPVDARAQERAQPCPRGIEPRSEERRVGKECRSRVARGD